MAEYDILNLTDFLPDPDLRPLFKSIGWNFRLSLGIDLFEPKKFDNYFILPKKIKHAVLNHDKSVDGIYSGQYMREHHMHGIAVKFLSNEQVIPLLAHELIHAVQYEIFGKFYLWWIKLRLPRHFDLFEIWATLVEMYWIRKLKK